MIGDALSCNLNKDIQMTIKTQQIYYDLLLQGYMFRLLRVIIRPSNEPIVRGPDDDSKESKHVALK